MRIATEECKLERKLAKENVESFVCDAIASEPRLFIIW